MGKAMGAKSKIAKAKAHAQQRHKKQKNKKKQILHAWRTLTAQRSHRHDASLPYTHTLPLPAAERPTHARCRRSASGCESLRVSRTPSPALSVSVCRECMCMHMCVGDARIMRMRFSYDIELEMWG